MRPQRLLQLILSAATCSTHPTQSKRRTYCVDGPRTVSANSRVSGCALKGRMLTRTRALVGGADQGGRTCPRPSERDRAGPRQSRAAEHAKGAQGRQRRFGHQLDWCRGERHRDPSPSRSHQLDWVDHHSRRIAFAHTRQASDQSDHCQNHALARHDGACHRRPRLLRDDVPLDLEEGEPSNSEEGATRGRTLSDQDERVGEALGAGCVRRVRDGASASRPQSGQRRVVCQAQDDWTRRCVSPLSLSAR